MLIFAQGFPVNGEKLQFHSNTLCEDRIYQISLPESYNWAMDRKYPVLYVLDGESNFTHTASSVGFLAAHGEIPEMIVVGINSTVRIRDYTQTDWSDHWVGGGGADKFQYFLAQELVPEIEKHYRSNGYRILSGHSAAGQFVLYCLSDKPGIFNAYIAISPSLDWDNRLPLRALEESLRKTSNLNAFLYFAQSDDAGQALEDDNRLVQIVQLNSPKGFRWVNKAFPEETHVSVPLVAQIDAVRQVYRGYRLHDDSLALGISYAEMHFAALSERVGYSISIPEEVINNLGYEALDRGDITAAIELFNKNIEQNPYSANAYDSIADAYKKSHRWQDAINSVEHAIALAEQYGNPNLTYFYQHVKSLKEQQIKEPGK